MIWATVDGGRTAHVFARTAGQGFDADWWPRPALVSVCGVVWARFSWKGEVRRTLRPETDGDFRCALCRRRLFPRGLARLRVFVERRVALVRVAPSPDA